MTEWAMAAAVLALLMQVAPPAPAPATAPPSVPATAPAPPPPGIINPVPLQRPSDLIVAFISAERALAQLSVCVGTGSTPGPRALENLDARLAQLDRLATGVWGIGGTVDPLAAVTAITPDCSTAGAAKLHGDAQARITAIASRLADLLKPLARGAWLGALPLCAHGRPGAKWVESDYAIDRTLVLTFPAPTAAALRDLTARHLGHALALRLDGKIIMEPVINEPIHGGQVQLSGFESTAMEDFAARFARCRL